VPNPEDKEFFLTLMDWIDSLPDEMRAELYCTMKGEKDLCNSKLETSTTKKVIS